jgi:hypothetical protein
LLDKCSAEVKIDARNDVCHIIGLWFNLLKEEYNKGLPDSKQARNIGWLYDKITKEAGVKTKVRKIVKDKCGMGSEELDAIFTYKLNRNDEVHRDSLNKSKKASVRFHQYQRALRLLRLAPNQEPHFPTAFEKCAEWVYRN